MHSGVLQVVGVGRRLRGREVILLIALIMDHHQGHLTDLQWVGDLLVLQVDHQVVVKLPYIHPTEAQTT